MTVGWPDASVEPAFDGEAVELPTSALKDGVAFLDLVLVRPMSAPEPRTRDGEVVKVEMTVVRKI